MPAAPERKRQYRIARRLLWAAILVLAVLVWAGLVVVPKEVQPFTFILFFGAGLVLAYHFLEWFQNRILPKP